MEKAALQYSTDFNASIRIAVDEALYLQMEHLAHSSQQYLLWNSKSKFGKAGNRLYQKLLSGK